jgi:tetratricopeptide (TPR) repeat protein
MVKRLLVFVTVVAAASALLLFPVCENSVSQEITQDEAYYNERGLSYFKEGFYTLLPRGMKEEASQCLEQAITAFKAAIAINDTYVDAHRNLARVYYVQRRYSEAAEEYKRVTELIPYDIDVYVKLASAYVKLKQYSEAIEQLEKAKTFTAEKIMIDRLNDFIQRLEHME